MAAGTIRYWASARAAAGLSEEPVAASTLAEAIEQVVARREDGAALKAVLDVCAFLLDGSPVGRRDRATVALDDDGWVVEALPPFAGG